MQITFKGNEVHTSGEMPKVGMLAPDFDLTAGDLSQVTLESFRGQKVLLNIFPSLDTQVCAASVRRFNQDASQNKVTTLCISADLPFAHSRFCSTEGVDNVIPLSVFRNPEFGQNYGLLMEDGPLKGLLARAVIVLNEQGEVIYTELVPEITQEPNYAQALKAL